MAKRFVNGVPYGPDVLFCGARSHPAKSQPRDPTSQEQSLAFPLPATNHKITGNNSGLLISYRAWQIRKIARPRNQILLSSHHKCAN